MIFLAQSPCTWVSQCGKYQIVHHVAGFGMDIFTVNTEGYPPLHHLTLTKAQDWCSENARLTQPVPETDFATHCEQQR